MIEFLSGFEEDIVFQRKPENDELGVLIHKFDNHSDLKTYKIAILGVCEDRGTFTNKGTAFAPDQVRRELFRLKIGGFKQEILDMGNILPGHEFEDTLFAVSTVLETLMKNGITPVILGGSQDLTYAQYLSYKNLEQTVNLIAIDHKFDLGKPEDPLGSESYLGKIILHQPNYLFNFSNIGFQSYFESEESISLMDRMFFETYRLGQVRQNIEEMEPVIRSGDLLSVDISAVRGSDAPGNGNSGPNGFYGEEICRLLRYAGFNDKLSSVGIYEINPEMDSNNRTSALAAQMIWYFLDGYSARKSDFPVNLKKGFQKYHVAARYQGSDIVFYKSPRSEKWWMEVPLIEPGSKYIRHHIVPCSYYDYEKACNEEIPERWWQTFKKLS